MVLFKRKQVSVKEATGERGREFVKLPGTPNHYETTRLKACGSRMSGTVATGNTQIRDMRLKECGAEERDSLRINSTTLRLPPLEYPTWL